MTHPTRIPTLVLALLLLAAGAGFGQLRGSLAVDQTRLQGTHASGEPLLFAPDPVQPGSSVSHWDASASPNLLMEPAINADLAFLDLDITPNQMEDIGWPLNPSGDPANGAPVVITSLDPPGVGLDDPTPFAGAPGNPATTLGEARLNLINAVLGAWSSELASNVPIDVGVTFQPLFCAPGAGAALAGAVTTFIFATGDPADGLPFLNTWYHAALTEAIVGADLTGPWPDGGDIFVVANSSIDTGCLGSGTSFYYGLDGNDPPNQIDFAPVMLHEIGHGLGFANFMTETTGQLTGGLPGVFSQFTFDHTQGKTIAQMSSDAERMAAAIDFGNLTWNGPSATAAANALLAPGVPELTLTSPPELAGGHPIGTAIFGPPLTSTPIEGRIVPMLDTIDDTVNDLSPTNGCGTVINPNALAGNIALIDRGLCPFTQKVINAQDAGATAAIIINNAGNTPITMGGSDPAVSIPAVSVGRTLGNRMRQASGDLSAGFIGDRFQVTAHFDTGRRHGIAATQALTSKSTWSSFVNPENPEFFVKILNGCAINGHYWAFIGAGTSEEVWVTITDTSTGVSRSYRNEMGNMFPSIQDVNAFATCP